MEVIYYASLYSVLRRRRAIGRGAARAPSAALAAHSAHFDHCRGGRIFGLRSRSTTTTMASTATVSQGDLTISVTGSGAVAAARTVELPFQQPGTITSVDVRVGDNVTAGQTLATIDPA